MNVCHKDGAFSDLRGKAADPVEDLSALDITRRAPKTLSWLSKIVKGSGILALERFSYMIYDCFEGASVLSPF
ncbi:hypothetical protein JS562_03260 [Agrobacterium sp. S2]|nr:hypothetical protein [Agrobacterium sp. S2]